MLLLLFMWDDYRFGSEWVLGAVSSQDGIEMWRHVDLIQWVPSFPQLVQRANEQG